VTHNPDPPPPPIRYTAQEQRERAAKKAMARPRNPRQPNAYAGCAHCGGAFPLWRHRSICVKHGLA
jgi:hypothetical protein